MFQLMTTDNAADELPLDLPPYPLFDRVLVARIGDRLTLALAFRWLPIIRWRYLSRAWQGYPAHGEFLATAWTGRERELIGWEWPVKLHTWTGSQLAAARFHHEFARDVLPVFPMRYTDGLFPDHRPDLIYDRLS